MNLLALILILGILLFIYIKLNFRGFETQNKLMKIICKTSLSKDSHILIMKVIDKYYLCSSNQSGVNIIEHLDENKVLEYIDTKKATLLKKG